MLVLLFVSVVVVMRASVCACVREKAILWEDFDRLSQRKWLRFGTISLRFLFWELFLILKDYHVGYSVNK